MTLLLSISRTLLLDTAKNQCFPNSTLGAMNQDFLSLLPYDILRQVCLSVSSDHDSAVPLDGVSRSNKHLRDICLPEMFRNVTVRGRWELASSRLEALEGCHAVLSLVK